MQWATVPVDIVALSAPELDTGLLEKSLRGTDVLALLVLSSECLPERVYPFGNTKHALVNPIRAWIAGKAVLPDHGLTTLVFVGDFSCEYGTTPRSKSRPGGLAEIDSSP
jgi:hypothetical protein